MGFPTMDDISQLQQEAGLMENSLRLRAITAEREAAEALAKITELEEKVAELEAKKKK